LELAWNLERELEAPVRAERMANASAADPRRGERDVIVIQVAGQTEWKVHGSEPAQASAEPGWAARLDAGGALYLPRGWWRSIRSCDQHTVSWFFHVHNPTGADLLLWLADKAKDYDAFQTDIPRFGGPAAKAAYLTRLRKAFGGAFRTPGLLEAHARRLNRLAPAHPPRGKGWGEDLSPEDTIALATPRQPKVFRKDRETLYLAVGGKELLFAADAAPLLQYLLDKAPVAMGEFYRQFDGEFDREDLVRFLAVLSQVGVVTFQPPERTAE
jgi:hypothetical protein